MCYAQSGMAPNASILFDLQDLFISSVPDVLEKFRAMMSGYRSSSQSSKKGTKPTMPRCWAVRDS